MFGSTLPTNAAAHAGTDTRQLAELRQICLPDLLFAGVNRSIEFY